MQIRYHFSSDHKPAFEADQLIVPTYSTLMCILQSPGSPELGSSQMRLVQRMRAVSQGSWTRRLTQDWARAGKTRSPWNAYTEVVSPRSFTLQVLLHCHVYILCLPRHSNPEGNKCSTPRFPVVRPCLGVSWWPGASPRGHRARKTFGSRRQGLSFQHTAVLAQCLPSLALGLLQQVLGYYFHRKVLIFT